MYDIYCINKLKYKKNTFTEPEDYEQMVEIYLIILF